ncbi:MAG: UDP-N-acetylmuramyl-tripeptide synthetase [Patescibacteria group bacterium]
MPKIKRLFHFILAFVAYWFYGRPSRKLVVIGVTGTKGKSTTSRFIAEVLEAAVYKVGLLSTVEFQIGEERWLNDRKMTMLGRGQIQSMLRKMVNKKCTHVVVETSSEGILQYRHYGLNYDVAVFTNLGTEHSERHGGYENLRSDKGQMFASLTLGKRKKVKGKIIPKVIVANGDDKEARFFLSYPADRKYLFTFNPDHPAVENVEIVTGRIESKHHGFVVGNEMYKLSLLGKFNCENALAAVVVGKSFGIDPGQIADGLLKVELVPGRMEFIDEGQLFKVVVDYAHEPMSLTALFSTLRSLTTGKLIAVVGSDGGGRDKQKRERMGEIAGQMADIVVITDVNCYDENPTEIAEMLAKGARAAGKMDGNDLFIQVNRREAMKAAFAMARQGDIVVVTAKGTEPYIGVANGKRIPWDDRKVSRELIREAYV